MYQYPQHIMIMYKQLTNQTIVLINIKVHNKLINIKCVYILLNY